MTLNLRVSLSLLPKPPTLGAVGDPVNGYQKHVKSSGALCPFCESIDTTAGPIQADGPVAWAEVECEDCGNVWQDVWELVHIAQARRRDGRGIEG